MRVLWLCMLGMMAAVCVFGAHGEEEPMLLYSQAPEFVAADVSANILVCETRHAVIGYDMDSGEERWRYKLEEDQKSHFSNNKNIVLHDHLQTYRLLCKATGKIVCDISHDGEQYSFFVWRVPGTNWLQSQKMGENGKIDEMVLYSPDGSKQFEVPVNCLVGGFTPDEKTVFGVNLMYGEDKVWPSQVDVCFWQLGNTVIERSFPLNFDQDELFGLIPAENRMLCGKLSERKEITEFFVVDIFDGSVQRKMPVPEESGHICTLTPDGKEIMLLSRDKQTVWLLNSTDGALLTTLNMPDHTFLWGTISYDSSGNAYIVSKDGQGSAWLWAVAPDASPRKIFDGSQYFSGTIVYFKPPYFLTTEDYDNPLDENFPYMLLSIFRMDDGHIQKVDAWPVMGRYFSAQRDNQWSVAGQDFNNQYCSDDMQRFIGVRGPFLTKHAKSEERKMIPDCHVVYEKGKTEPIIESQDARFTGISPNGKYITVHDRRGMEIVQVDSQKEVVVFPHSPRTIRPFSPDGQRIALYQNGELIVVNLAGGYHQIVMYIPDSTNNFAALPAQFSADGSRLLSFSKGRVLLHDTDTGELLATFLESKRLVSRDVYIHNAPGFVNNLLGDAVNVAAYFTDHAKEAPWLGCAFAANDTQVLTIAMDQLIRVWDARSGKQLKAIEISGEKSDYPRENSVILSPNGAYAYITRDRRFWDIAAGRMIGQYRSSGHNSAFSNDGEIFYFWKNDAVYYLPIHANQTQNN